MAIASRAILLMVLLPLLLFGVEWLLAVKYVKASLILPVVVMCFTFWLGTFALLAGLIMYCICGVAYLVRKQKKTERERMDIQDL